MVSDPGKDIRQPCLRIDAVQLGGFDQGIGDRGCLPAAFRTDKQVIFTPEGHTAHRSFGCVVVQFQNAVIEVVAHLRHACQRIADRLREFRFV